MQKSLNGLKILILALVLSFGTSYALAAWTGPTANPPGGNTPAPINVSGVTQTKAGPFIAGLLRSFTDVYVDGRLGVGTTDPQRLVHLAENYPGGTPSMLSLENTSGTNNSGANLSFRSTVKGTNFSSGFNEMAAIRSVYQGVEGVSTEAGRKGTLKFYTANGIGLPPGSLEDSHERMRITSDGKVGIGTYPDDPSQKLEVRGNVLADNFQQPSDRRLKENIRPLQTSLPDINKLLPARYTLISTGEENIGLIAQDVEAVFPEAVKTSKTTGYKSIEYSQLTAALIKATQELSAENDALKAQLSNLEARVRVLEAR